MPFDKNKVFQSDYLKADDIPATGVDVKIESTWEEEVDYQNGQGLQMTAQMKFVEFPKPLGLNVTNTESIEQLLGKDNSKWDGGVIRLYRTTTRNRAGAVVPCIRIQPPLGAPAAPGAAETKQEPYGLSVAGFGAKIKGIFSASMAPSAVSEKITQAITDLEMTGFWRDLTDEQREKLFHRVEANEIQF